MPQVTGNGSSSSADSAWIGIGGVSSGDLIQAGTIDSVSASGRVTYYAFYEMLPAPALLISNFAIAAGDVMKSNINETATDAWSVSIMDVTENETYATTVTYTSSLSSAEWIEEDLTGPSGLMPLDTFGSTTFTDGLTTVGSTSLDLSAADVSAITLIDGSGKVLATPTVLTSDGGGFTVNQST